MALKRVFAGGGLNALRRLESGLQLNPEDVSSITEWLESKGIKKPIETPRPNRLSDRLYNLLGETPESLSPRNIPERVAQSLIEASPLALQGLSSGGRQGLKTAAKGFGAGQATRAGLSVLGVPEDVRNLGQLAAESAVGYRSAKKKMGSLSDIRDLEYQKARESLKEGNFGDISPDLKKFLKKSDSIYRTEVDTKTRQEVSDIINVIKSNVMKDGKVNIENLWDTNKSLGKQYTKASPSLRTYITEARKGIEKTLVDHSAANPKFAHHRPTADELHTYIKSGNIIKEFFDGTSLKGINPLKVFKVTGIPLVLDKLESIGRAALTPSVRKYYGELTNAVIKDNPKNAIKYAIMLSDKVNDMNLIDEEWTELPDQSEEWILAEE